MMPNYTAVALVVLTFNFTCTCKVKTLPTLTEGASRLVSEGWHALSAHFRHSLSCLTAVI